MKTTWIRKAAAMAIAAVMALGTGTSAAGAGDSARTAPSAAAYVQELAPLVGASPSELRDVVERYVSDRAAINRRYQVGYSPLRRSKQREFYQGWQSELERMNFNALGADARIDYALLKNEIWYQLELHKREETMLAEMADLAPFASTIIELQEKRRDLETIDPAASARTLDQLGKQVENVRKAVEAGLQPARGERSQATSESAVTPIKPTKIVAFRAAQFSENLRRTLEQWSRYYSGYHPLFTWWTAAPYKKTDDELRAYVRLLRERVVGIRQNEPEPIIGDPIGRDGLLIDLQYEMIPYTPEELVAIAEREYAWCEAEMKKASRELGYGDDWKKALEHVKNLYVPPGEQPDLIRDLAYEAIEFVTSRDLLTVPPLARDIWRVEMLSPERQRESPFFLGGEVIQVSYPTDTMSHEDKLMSMRGNNPHFSRATVHHELIPGHHLQGFMTERYARHRRVFGTPFWTEGWALHWEMVLWDLNFPRGPEDKVGMLFWRMHRAARIIFSLSFHLGTMTPQQCIDLLVDRVGHERANATAEVRRSFRGNYSPLYQMAYMMGAMQIQSLHRELVKSGKMTSKQFHDRILQSGRMPIEMVRATLTGARLPRDFKSNWRFAGEIPAQR